MSQIDAQPSTITIRFPAGGCFARRRHGLRGAAANSPNDYKHLTTDEAMQDAASYNMFAEYVTFGTDSRFGRFRDDLTTFEYGSRDTSG